MDQAQRLSTNFVPFPRSTGRQRTDDALVVVRPRRPGRIDRELAAMAAAASAESRSPSSIRSSAASAIRSPEFLADLATPRARPRELGLRFDLTLGSGWSFGGPHISAELRRPQAPLGAARDQPGRAADPGGRALAGRRVDRGLIGADRCRKTLTSSSPLPVVDGSTRDPAGRRTSSRAARLADSPARTSSARPYGAEGPVLDHYSAAAARRTSMWSVIRCSRRSRCTCSARCSATASRCTAATGPPACWPSSARRGYGRAAGAVPAGRRRSRRGRDSERTTTGPCPSCTRITSSPCSSTGPHGQGCRSGSRATASRPPC